MRSTTCSETGGRSRHPTIDTPTTLNGQLPSDFFRGAIFIHDEWREEKGIGVRVVAAIPQAPIAPVEVRDFVYGKLIVTLRQNGVGPNKTYAYAILPKGHTQVKGGPFQGSVSTLKKNLKLPLVVPPGAGITSNEVVTLTGMLAVKRQSGTVRTCRIPVPGSPARGSSSRLKEMVRNSPGGIAASALVAMTLPWSL